MTKHPKKIQWGFTEDQVFGEVMSNMEFCKYILQVILGPEVKIKNIKRPTTQDNVKDPSHREEKDVIVDVIVEDDEGNLYDIEMQVADDNDLGWRLRYYAAKLDQRYTLKKGSTYKDLKNAYLIFLCKFDPIGDNKIKYVFHTYEDSDRSKKLIDGMKKVMINAKGIPTNEGRELLALVDLMNDKPVHLNKHFDYAQDKILFLNTNPEWRDRIMDYETKMKEREVVGEKRGRQQEAISGIKKTIKILKSIGESKEEIYQQLISNYGDDISSKELKNLIN